MAHIKNDKEKKKKVGGRRGAERKLSSVASWKENLWLASWDKQLPQASYPGQYSSNIRLSLQQLHCFVQDSLKLPTDCSHFQCKIWAGGGAVWLISWWALYFWAPWFKPKLQPKERQGKRSGWFLPWWQSLPLECAMPTLLEYTSNIPSTSRRALWSQEILVPLHGFHGTKSIICAFWCHAAEDKECCVTCLILPNTSHVAMAKNGFYPYISFD